MDKQENKNYVDFEAWPEAPLTERPKKLFTNQTVSQEILAALWAKGWLLVDTRVLPNDSDADKAYAVKCVLEGVRIGSIFPLTVALKHLELEARVYGLLAAKELAEQKPKESNALEDLLGFARDVSGMRPRQKRKNTGSAADDGDLQATITTTTETL